MSLFGMIGQKLKRATNKRNLEYLGKSALSVTLNGAQYYIESEMSEDGGSVKINADRIFLYDDIHIKVSNVIKDQVLKLVTEELKMDGMKYQVVK